MQPTSPLSLFLFIHLVSASPIPIVLPDCKSSACTAFVSNPNTPPTRLTEPHFPKHQVTPNPTDNEVFDNTPVTPSAKLSPHAALGASVPLSSAFLKSLTNPASKPPQQDPILNKVAETTEDLPAKPTSALPELREEDARLYWASRGGSSSDVEAASDAEGPRQEIHRCGSTKYSQAHRTKTSRDYSDFMVVGIVLLFLAVVVALEAVEKIEELRNFFTGRRQRTRGEIYLEDDETVAFIVKKPVFQQQKAPPLYKVEYTTARDVNYEVNEKA